MTRARITLILASFLACIVGRPATAIFATPEITITVDLPGPEEYRIEANRILLDGGGQLTKLGDPQLPTHSFTVALPPGARAQSVDVELLGGAPLLGTFELAPSRGVRILGELGSQPTPISVAPIYTTDRIYPQDSGWLIGSGSAGRYAYAAVGVCPVQYDPAAGRIVLYNSARITVHYAEGPSGQGVLKHHGPATLFANYEEIRPHYPPPEKARDLFNYVIITTADLADQIAAAEFVAWKVTLGHRVRVVSVTDPEITAQSGADLAEQIRSFLRARHAEWGIEYVLLVGDYRSVPMRYCYPDPSNHSNTAGTPGGGGGEVPTDFYYADLSAPDEDSWDSDGDGYYGEYGDDAPDFFPEVYVGRIPVNDWSRVQYTLAKTVTFEQDTGAWKEQALHAGAFFYFTNEDHSGHGPMDGARFPALIETDLMQGWTLDHFSEQQGLEVSVYPWSPLSEPNLTSAWRNGQYAVMNWGAHGWSNRIARKVWAWDDGDGVPEAAEMAWPDMLGTGSNLDDDHPAIIFGISCYVGYPEPNAWGNLGIDLLTRETLGAGIGVITSTRTPYGSIDWPPHGGAESICYEFNANMIAGSQPIGKALYDAKFYCNTHYGWTDYFEYTNLYIFNLYGDPALLRTGVPSGSAPVASDEHSWRLELVGGMHPIVGPAKIRCYAPSTGTGRLEIVDVTGRCVRSLRSAQFERGWHELYWDGCDDAGRRLNDGVYWVRLALPEENHALRLLRMAR